MNLTVAEIRELPLPAALLDRDGEVIAATPEWGGAGPGTVIFALRHTRLAVAVVPADPAAAVLLDGLLAAMDATAGLLEGAQRLRITMLAASLRLVAGRQVTTVGTSHDVIDLAVAGIGARTALAVHVDGRPAFPVRAPQVAALVLVQLAVNAERHTRTTTVTLVQDGEAFHVIWPGAAGPGAFATARNRRDRQRWGLGFCRIAADTLGGAIYPPADRGDGTVCATLELGLQDLTLPVALIRGHRVAKATRTWDEETGCLPGAGVEPGSRLAACLDAASVTRGRAVTCDGWTARQVRERSWVAIPPDDVLERARDVLDGIGHERALWEGIAPAPQMRVFALTALLAARLGTPLPRVPAGIWNQRMGTLAAALRLPMDVPRLTALGGIEPRIAGYLAAELGTEMMMDGDDLLLRIRPGMERDARLLDLVRVGDAVRLS
ncbi:MAG: hypothetical protein ABSE52_11875 [Candidatus Dormibacteria bacterium]|jgi:hypothetical protein